jgi:pimeloyl-ACP methyl ester carboxylesterase
MSEAARVIAVHGWIADRHLFDPLLPHLDPQKLDFVGMNCRGYGVRRNDGGPYRIETIAGDVVHTADELGWEKFHVLGHSMGGMAAQHLMVHHPQRLHSAILLAPVPACGIHAGELSGRAVLNREARKQLIATNSGGVRDDVWQEEMVKLSFDTTMPEALDGYRQAWTETDFSAGMVNATTPLLSIVGALDPGITAALLRETIQTWCPNALLIEMERCGHYAMREAPAELARLLHFRLDAF